MCQYCQRKHHTSICDRLVEQLMTATSVGNSAVIHLVVVVEVQGVNAERYWIRALEIRMLQQHSWIACEFSLINVKCPRSR